MAFCPDAVLRRAALRITEDIAFLFLQEASGLNAESFNKTAKSAANDEVGAFAGGSLGSFRCTCQPKP
jgi:hypothetical protein